jgi:hypothetical protein
MATAGAKDLVNLDAVLHDVPAMVRSMAEAGAAT